MVQPIWLPGTPSHFGERYFVFSPKLGRFVAISSKLEMEQVLLLEFDLAVKSYCEQPTMAEAIIDGRLLKSRFDFWVLDVDGSARFLEVKYASDLRDPLSRAHRQIAIQKKWCEEQGYEHRIVTDEQIWVNPIRINSLRTLLHEYTGRFPRVVIDASQAMPEVERIIWQTPSISIRLVLELRPRTVSLEVWRLAIMELIRSGVVDAALERVALSPKSQLRIRDGGAK